MNAKSGIRCKHQLANAGIRYADGVSDFGEYFKNAVLSAGFEDVKAFAPAAKRSQADLSRIVNGKRRPPLDMLDAWADALKLDRTQRRIFKMLAGLEHIKNPEVRALIADELFALRQRLDQFRQRLSRLP